MHRVDTPGAVDGRFQDGNPAIGQQATQLASAFMNDLQENVCKAIEGAGIVLAKGNETQLLSAIQALAQVGGLAPSAVGFFRRSTAPAGWLKANGAAVSRTTYAALFAAIGTSEGAGDGVTTFNLPDLRGEFIRAWDDGRGVDTGRTLGSAQSGQNLSHNHASPTSSSTSAGDYEVTVAAGVVISGTRVGGFASYDFEGTAGARAYTDTSGGSEARPRNVAWLACIKF